MIFFDSLKKKIKEDKHFNELFSGFSTALILRITGLFFSYLFIALVSRKFGAKAVGVFALSLTFLNIYSTLGTIGTGTLFLRFCAEFKSERNRKALKNLFKKVALIVLTASLIVSVVAFYNADFFSTSLLKKTFMKIPLIIVAFSTLPFSFFIIVSEGIRGFKMVKEYMLFRFVGLNFLSILFLFLLPFILNMHYKTPFFEKTVFPILAFVLSVFVLLFFVFYVWIKEYRNIPELKERGRENQGFLLLLSISIPMLFSNSLSLIINWADTIMLGMFKSAETVGYYNVASRISKIIVIILMAINTIAAPKFAEFWGKKDIAGLVKIARQSTKLIFWTTFPVFLFFILSSNFLLGIFGKEFQVATVCLIILLIGFFYNAVCGSVGLILLMTGHQVFHQNVMFIGALANIILNYLLIPKYGINGAAFASAITMIFWNTLYSFKVRKITGKWIFYPRIY
ncbi:polysaccharide biosynthesis protein [Thermotomaculum hydrothermale]|uniref:Polysaccharide biosynthesis protein n=1 Tax=Thermotomaculum hydrothermale TaxID=981385 RepID=A0A7R6PVJ1_9BACT|nr:flippase [Thermotomaculum hydrothermale]BBB33402.1 polysaccharide biosynthesis protein [Thermotomaculum hydrothermale]